jgi:hypothetical protein
MAEAAELIPVTTPMTARVSATGMVDWRWEWICSRGLKLSDTPQVLLSDWVLKARHSTFLILGDEGLMDPGLGLTDHSSQRLKTTYTGVFGRNPTSKTALQSIKPERLSFSPTVLPSFLNEFPP